METESPFRHAPDVIRRVTPPPQAGEEKRGSVRSPVSSPVYGGGAERAKRSEAEGGALASRHSHLAQDIARAWIGTPYVHQASVRGAGCDCLGLLRGVFRELTGEEPEAPPPYSPDWAEATGAETLYSALRRHLAEIELSRLVPGDVALFRMHPRGPAKHCGIVGTKDAALTLIHSRQNKRVSEEIFSASWRKKLAYAFRL